MKKSTTQLFVDRVENAVSKLTIGGETQLSISGREYKGINKILLLESIVENKYTSNIWYPQADKLNIKDNEKPTMLFSSKIVELKNEDTGEINKTKTTRYYFVFNQEQLVENFNQ
jgi:antirestriction protein ArdC